jgi:hypothetical protein
MPVTARFARLRDGSLRLRLEATGPEIKELSSVCVLRRSQHFEEDFYTGHVTVEAPSIESFMAKLETLGGPWTQFAIELNTNYQRLCTRPTTKKSTLESAAVLDDGALRKLVRARPAPEMSLVIDELGIQGAFVRADVATLTPLTWTGVELKGHTDSLARLPRQVLAYSAVFDLCEVVTTPKHLAKVQELLPPWWALSVASQPGIIERIKEGSRNPSPDDFSRCQLLWRDEALELLRTHGAARGLSTSARFYVWQRLADTLRGDDLRSAVFSALQARPNWLRNNGRTRAPF